MSSPIALPYPELAPYRIHTLAVSHGHVLHIEERGRPDGIAALVLHGGPGSGASPLLSRFFDPSRYRVIGPIRNLDAWYAAFGIKSDSKFYIPPEQRVRIW